MNPGGGKRAVDRSNYDEGNKSRRLSGALLAALKEDILCRPATHEYLESMIRSVVAEEIERSLSSYAMRWRVPQRQITGCNSTRKLRLHFMSNPTAMTFTDTKFENTIRVSLIDHTTGQFVTEGPESVAQLEVVPLIGDFNIPEEEEWTADEFERHVAKEREGKAPLLAGELKVYLKGGFGTLGELYFTDNSSWTRSGKFRLGVCVARDNDKGLASIIREGKSQAFAVRDSRGRGYMKLEEPKPNDEVWRLRHIGKGGPIHKKLMQHGIHTVQDFLHWICHKPGDLKEVLGKMPAKAYEGAVEHAKKCITGDRMFVYPVNQPPYEEVIFNQDYQPAGAVSHGQYIGLNTLNDTQKVQMDALLKSAYDNWSTNVSECLVGEPATVEEPPAETGSRILDVEPTPPYTQALDYELIDTEEQHNSSGMINLTSPLWMNDNSEMIPLWKHDYSGMGTCANGDDEGLTPDNIARLVKEVLWEDDVDNVEGEPTPTPPTSRWWLRIRALVRCALFIRKAGFVQQH